MSIRDRKVSNRFYCACVALLLSPSLSLAELKFSVPAGFRSEAVNQSFSLTGTSFDWLKVSDSTLALYLYDFNQIRGIGNKRVREYERNLTKYSDQAITLSQTIKDFDQWLLKANVQSLHESLNRGPVNFVVDPMTDLAVTDAHFRSLTNPTGLGIVQWWIHIDMEPVQDLDYQFGYTPVMIHEMGHFLFQTSLLEMSSPRTLPKTISFPLGPLDEGFADFVSFAFTGNPVVGKRFEFEEGRTVEYRRALSSSLEDRAQVRKGEYFYKQGQSENHLRGQAFRDVLIEISRDYGAASSFQALREIQKDLMKEGSPLFDPLINQTQINGAFNAAIKNAFSAYPKL